MPGLAVTTVWATYVGGPTLLLEYAWLRILTDPTFDPPGRYDDQGSTPLVKTAGPGLPLAQIEPVEAILLSHHEHPDNLDAAGRVLVGAARMLGARVVVGVHTEDGEHFSETRADLESAFAADGMADLLLATPRG